MYCSSDPGLWMVPDGKVYSQGRTQWWHQTAGDGYSAECGDETCNYSCCVYIIPTQYPLNHDIPYTMGRCHKRCCRIRKEKERNDCMASGDPQSGEYRLRATWQDLKVNGRFQPEITSYSPNFSQIEIVVEKKFECYLLISLMESGTSFTLHNYVLYRFAFRKMENVHFRLLKYTAITVIQQRWFHSTGCPEEEILISFGNALMINFDTK